MRTFDIFGTIVDTDGERMSYEDTTPLQVSSFLKKLEDGEEITFNINSPGGSVTAGISIANMIKACSRNGHKTIAKVGGLAASIASVIMCACDEIILSDSSFVMLHRPWSVVQGNSQDLRKEAEVMDKMMEAMLSFYRSKFDLTDEELIGYLDAETWFSGNDVETFKLKCEVIHDDTAIPIAAQVNISKWNYKNIPEKIIMENKEEKIVDVATTPVDVVATEETKIVEVQSETVEQIVAEVEEKEKEEPSKEEEVENTCEEKKEEKDYEATIAELNKTIEDLKAKLAQYEEEEEDEENVSKAECEKRVSGMQSTMAKKMDTMKSEYEAKLNDFTSQLKVRDEELITVKNEITSLVAKLDKSEKELSEMTSAFEEKNNALAMLNAGVNAPREELPTMEEGLKACTTPSEKVAFLKSGKYIR